MGFFSGLLNPVAPIRAGRDAVRSLSQGDLGGAVDPNHHLIPKAPVYNQPTPVAPRSSMGLMPMPGGAQPTTINLGGVSPTQRAYVPNRFAQQPMPMPGAGMSMPMSAPNDKVMQAGAADGLNKQAVLASILRQRFGTREL